ncbi:MAG: hypothetical protein OXN44_14295 [Acidimicrobiaceae bacterium]|nr:hypothetical protein [Acidimicrobiaceae bacterium]
MTACRADTQEVAQEVAQALARVPSPPGDGYGSGMETARSPLRGAA